MQKNSLAPEELSLVLQSVTEYAIFTLDEHGRVTMWNEGAQRVFGFSDEDMVGHSTEKLFTPEDRERGAHLQEMCEAAREGRAADERYHIRRDGSRFFASGVLFPVRQPAGEIRGYVKVCRDLTDRQEWEQKLVEAQERLESRVAERTEQLLEQLTERRQAEQRARAMLSRLIAVQEDERRRIARDLHDHLGQQVTALHLQLETLKKELQAAGHQALSRLDTIQTMFQQLDRDLDFFTWELRPGALYNVGLVAALTDFTAAFSTNYGLPVRFDCDGLEDRELPPHVAINLYRIAQEALNNTYKHAKANRVDVLLQRVDGRVVLTVSDDGVGFTPGEIEIRQGVERGMGIGGMQERAALLGGNLQIESERTEGTSVIAMIPLPQ